MKKDFLTLNDLTRDDLLHIIERSAKLKALRGTAQHPRTLEGMTFALVFEKASSRTRLSFEVGIRELGGATVYLSAADSQFGRGEPIRDSAQVISSYCHGVVMRTFGHDRIEELARWCGKPVVNGLTDEFHPCQLLADLTTVAELRESPTTLRFAWVGDGNNMAHSWIRAAALLGFDLALACPEGYQPDPQILQAARVALSQAGEKKTIELFTDPQKAVIGADVISTDVWASMGQESEAREREKAFAGYCLDEAMLATAASGAIVLHCLPAHRGEEITAEVLDGPQSAVFLQAENRLHAQKALLEWLYADSNSSS